MVSTQDTCEANKALQQAMGLTRSDGIRDVLLLPSADSTVS